MAFVVTVHRISDQAVFDAVPADVTGAEFDAWAQRCSDLTIFDEALGAGATIFDYWSTPASQLGLRLLARMYDDGLRISGAELDELARELDVLERHWSTLRLDREGTTTIHEQRADGSWVTTQIPFEADLHERLGHVRVAIGIAKREPGLLLIS
jgi:hypothetical protein